MVAIEEFVPQLSQPSSPYRVCLSATLFLPISHVLLKSTNAMCAGDCRWTKNQCKQISPSSRIRFAFFMAEFKRNLARAFTLQWPENFVGKLILLSPNTRPSRDRCNHNLLLDIENFYRGTFPEICNDIRYCCMTSDIGHFLADAFGALVSSQCLYSIYATFSFM